ncbi:hypothetical protein OG203_26725 [Nocardia sp. NBC_01499]|uniref:hypothetical protein n=1 Tax=Nocardia sp. NBC_01499 TaxID=2903597 RepID=UPI00386A9212
MSGNNTRVESPLLAWPNEWGKQRPANKLIFALIVFCIGAAISVPYTIDFATSGNWLRATYGVAGGLAALTFIAILAPHLRVRRKSLPRDISAAYSDRNRTGLRIPYLSSWKPVLLIWLIVGIGFLVLRGIIFVTQSSEGNDSGRFSIDVGGIALIVVAIILAASIIWYLSSGKSRRGFVVLSEQGVSQSLGSTVRFIPWNDVGVVSPCIINNSLAVRINPARDARISVDIGKSVIDRMQHGYFEQNMDLHAWVLGIDPALLLYAVRFYWQHPEARHELGTDAVVDRMRRGDLSG